MSEAPKKIWVNQFFANRFLTDKSVRNGCDEYIRADLVDRLVDALRDIDVFGSDTLSGRADGGVDDREWQRGGVKAMTKLARAALKALEEE